MLKKFLTIIFLLALLGPTALLAQDNVMKLLPAKGNAGAPIELEIEVVNAVPFAAFQFDILLPGGFSYVPGSAVVTDRAVNHQPQGSVLDAGARFRGGAFAIPTTDFLGEEGVVYKFTLNTPAVPGVYPMPFSTVPGQTPRITTSAGVNVITDWEDGTVTLCDVFVFDEDITDVSCFGGDDGAIDVLITGGVGTLTYEWTGPNDFESVQQNISDLFAGDYVLTVTDGLGCEASETFTVGQPPALVVTSATFTSVFCFGGTSQVNIVAQGGTAPIAYTLDGVTNYDGNFNVTAGTYEFSVTDANDCGPITGTFTVEEPVELVVTSALVTDEIDCFGGLAGVTIAASGGTGVISYTLDGVTNETGVFSVAAGSYIYSATDANSCGPVTGTLNVDEPALLEVISAAVSSPILFFSGTGEVTIVAGGGTPPYAFTFDGETNATGVFTGVLAGTYTYSFTDANLCGPVTGSINVDEPDNLTGDVAPTNVSTPGADDGEIAITNMAGGSGNFGVSIDGINWITLPPGVNEYVFTDLPVGTYTVTIRDANYPDYEVVLAIVVIEVDQTCEEILAEFIDGLTLEMTESFDGLCLAADVKIGDITGTGLMVELFAEIADLPVGFAVVSIAGVTLTGDPAVDMPAVKAALITLMGGPDTEIGDLTSIDVVVVFTYQGLCFDDAIFVITFDTAKPEAQQVFNEFIGDLELEITEDFAGTCLSAELPIVEISGTGKMVELFQMISELPDEVVLVSIAGVEWPASMQDVKDALIALMLVHGETIGELDGESIEIEVVFANALDPECFEEVIFEITFDAAIPLAQQAFEAFLGNLETELEEDFAGTCLTGDQLIEEISGTGKMVELFQMISTLPSEVAVVSIAGVDWPATMLQIKNALIALMTAEGREFISDLDGVTILVPVVFANALDEECEETVVFEITFDTTIPDNPLTLVCTGVSVELNVDENCEVVVELEDYITVSGALDFTVTFKIDGEVVESPYTFTVGTFTVEVIAEDECGTEECSFQVIVTDVTDPVISCPGTIALTGCSTDVITGLVYSETPVVVELSVFVGLGGSASDNCGIDEITYQDEVAGTCPIVVNRTWTVEDASGNTAECVQVITITGPAVEVTGPENADYTSCDFENQDELDLAFAAWYDEFVLVEAGCGATPVITVAVAPSRILGGTVEVTITATDGCTSDSYTASFTVVPVTGSLSGFLTYNNTANTPLKVVPVKLVNDAEEYNTVTNEFGFYSFTSLVCGTYEVMFDYEEVKVLPVGGINFTDAAQVNSWFVSTKPNLIQKVRFLAGDVNKNLSLNTADAGLIQNYFLQIPGFTTFARNTWTFWKANETIGNNPAATDLLTVTIAGVAPVNQNFFGLVTGDFNRGFNPYPAKSDVGSVVLNYGPAVEVNTATVFDLPVVAEMNMEIAAASLILNFPSDAVEVLGVYLGGDMNTPVMFKVSGDELRIGWNTMMPLSVIKGQRLFTLRMKLISASDDDLLMLSLAANTDNEIADATFNAIENASISMNTIRTITVGVPGVPVAESVSLTSYPNPFVANAAINYSLPADGNVILEVTNILGEKVTTLVNEKQTAGDYTLRLDANALRPGIYFATITLEAGELSQTRTIKLLRQQ